MIIKLQNVEQNLYFLNDMKYIITYGDKKSNRYNNIEHLCQPQLGSGLHTKPDTVKFNSLPSDPDELVEERD